LRRAGFGLAPTIDFTIWPLWKRFIVGIDVIFGVLDLQSDSIAHFAHIGGALSGFIIIKIWQKFKKV
jgi:membrane associated rhomboid family serine protease